MSLKVKSISRITDFYFLQNIIYVSFYFYLPLSKETDYFLNGKYINRYLCILIVIVIRYKSW